MKGIFKMQKGREKKKPNTLAYCTESRRFDSAVYVI